MRTATCSSGIGTKQVRLSRRTGARAFACIILALGGCALRVHDRVPAIEPYAAIWMAAQAAPRAAPGVFGLQVRAVDVDQGRGYINSETDYRDPRNVTVRLEPGALAMLGPEPRAVLARQLRQHLRVQGAVQRTRIDFLADGQPSGKYYYQTHIQVTDLAQITRMDGTPAFRTTIAP